MDPALALAAGSLAADAALAGWMLFRGRGALDARGALRAALAVGGLTVFKAIAAKSLPGLESFFLVIHFVYLDLVVLAPALALAVLLAARRRGATRPLRGLAW